MHITLIIMFYLPKKDLKGIVWGSPSDKRDVIPSGWGAATILFLGNVPKHIHSNSYAKIFLIISSTSQS